MSKTQALTTLKTHLAQLFDSRHRGVEAVHYAKAQGYADGYIQALVDAGLVNDGELLAVVNEERRAAAARAERTVEVRLTPAPDFA